MHSIVPKTICHEYQNKIYKIKTSFVSPILCYPQKAVYDTMLKITIPVPERRVSSSLCWIQMETSGDGKLGSGWLDMIMSHWAQGGGHIGSSGRG